MVRRLKTVTEPGGKVTSYTFDKSGNKDTKTVMVGASVSISSYSYNMQNRLTATETKVNGAIPSGASYFYDNNGNMVGSASYSLTAGAPMDAGIGLSMLGG